MTDKDAMSPSTEDAIKYLEGMIFPQDFSPSTLRAVAVNEMAIAALRAQLECEKEHIGETTDMMPLTLDELREMDGEPVWCADGEEHSCYCIVNAESEDCIDSESGAWCFAFYGMTRDGENGLHNMGWLAYRSKPKEAQS